MTHIGVVLRPGFGAGERVELGDDQAAGEARGPRVGRVDRGHRPGQQQAAFVAQGLEAGDVLGAHREPRLQGAAPQAADSRVEKDRLIPAMVRWEGLYSDQLLETIDWCLCLNHMYRPQSVFALQKALTEKVAKPETPPQNWLGQVVGRFTRRNDAK